MEAFFFWEPNQSGITGGATSNNVFVALILGRANRSRPPPLTSSTLPRFAILGISRPPRAICALTATVKAAELLIVFFLFILLFQSLPGGRKGVRQFERHREKERRATTISFSALD